jgi:hypothetical protein
MATTLITDKTAPRAPASIDRRRDAGCTRLGRVT